MHILFKTIAAASVASILGAAPALAQGPARIEVGSLTCDVSAGVGAIIGSTRSMRCTFEPVRGRPETYIGRIQRFGLDVGVTTGGVMVWGVVAPSEGIRRGALSGTYVGASASATAGAGLGANVLVGGSRRSFSLQPVSVQGQTGLNLAAGVARLTLASPRRR